MKTFNNMPIMDYSQLLDDEDDPTMMRMPVTRDSVITYNRANDYLDSKLNKSDMVKLFKMSLTVRGSHNMLYKDGIPYTNETLQKRLNIASKSGFLAFIKRLKVLGVLHAVKNDVQGKSRVTYMMNPYYTNREQPLHQDVLIIFSDFPEE